MTNSVDYIYNLILNYELKNILELRRFVEKNHGNLKINDMKKINKIIEENLYLFTQVFEDFKTKNS
ncbi:hypothetical protein APV54_14045 [Staphylococcus aureus]|uniref:hypothetical protein n=1 Tax=Staphylococcaceae TaxID=90964 RepID=UPI000BA6AE1C|nr:MULTISPECIES: hypothetical protein [Staphylococcaceae]PAG82257.1 hypothetical protein APV66_14065 [Staphylococcus aureus]PAG83851.1 hypothetical protein APV69_14525 [Staphylococcus aureus]PAG85793.1 hypothetical protein APV54_14045 [Staphylococcus aureus]PAH07909.1 hypothetical protein APV86_13405 [Staphylococcus aureus]PAH07910.1 hypothetical protein APV86_13420 [Staphylococcus aureus]